MQGPPCRLNTQMELRRFTREELAAYDGRQGRPAYIAYRGLVYDVSASYHWRGGNHWVLHQAGLDLSAELEVAPHTEDLLLKKFPVIGEMAAE